MPAGWLHAEVVNEVIDPAVVTLARSCLSASSVNVTTGLKQAPSVTIPPATGPEIKYTVPGWNGVDQQEDFMVTKSVDLTYTSSPTVQLNFKHALSRIVFKAQNQNKNKTYLIKELALSNLKSKGTLNLLDSIPNAGATFPHTPGAYNVFWKAQFDSVTYKVDLGNTNVYVPYSTGTSGTDYTAITNASNGLMVLPQETVLGAFTGSTPEFGGVGTPGSTIQLREDWSTGGALAGYYSSYSNSWGGWGTEGYSG
ncbi:hypothetical protein AGMMS49525_06080 [Bacteroidia bacterium]|nr:hypothetical protein AGMMS49525_06080 [Bacteroidia bacterium]